MRVGIIGFLHESNTFIDSPTTIDNFLSDVLATGDDILLRFRDAPHEIGGFIAGLESESIEAVPMFAARATPSGPINDGALTTIHLAIQRELAKHHPLDGILAAVHGAAVPMLDLPLEPLLPGNELRIQDGQLDLDGLILTVIRDGLRNVAPLVATLDLHANLSQRMVDATDAIIGYRTNPHIDQRERGMEAARLMARTLRGEVKPTMAAAFPRVAINIEKQLTSEEPCRQLYQIADEMLHEPNVLSNSVLLGFPYADVAEMGSSVVVVTDNDSGQAQQLANQLAGYVEENRHQFAGEFLDVNAAVEQALQLDGPVLLLDMGDNVGGGSPGDGTALANEIHWSALRSQNPTPAFVCFCDREMVSIVREMGVGKSLYFPLGGKVETSQGRPFHAWARSVSLHDGKFTEDAITHGGITQFDQGPTAIVETDSGLTIMLTTNRVPPFSLRQMTAFGLDPADFQLIVAKGVHAPRAAYDAVCKHCLRVDTPGVTRADMTKLNYQHRRRPLFPFEEL